MIGNQRSGVFLSYARADGEQFAADLRERLRAQAPDIDIKQDRILLEGGVGWWKQLTEAIDSVEFLVLVMTLSAMQSDTIRKEWRYARQQGVCVYPVKAAPDSELKFSELPQWMKKAHFFDIDKEWETFIGHLHKGCDSKRVPFMAPDLPENFVQREEEFRQLKNLLLSADRKEPVAITTALSGAGGFGKTTLAAALCHDDDIIENFDDGILWVTLGQNPNVMSGLVTVYAALTGERPGFASEEDAVNYLSQKLEDRICLLVIDDVWDDSHLRPFLRGGKGCARLFTTRNAEIALAKARFVNVDEMSTKESQALLAKGVPGITAAHAQELSQRLREWPIALEIAAAMMRQRIAQGDSIEGAAKRLVLTLDKKGTRGLARGTGGHRTIDSVLEGSLELLTSEDRTRLYALAIFPEDTAIPLTAVAPLWGLDEFEIEDTAQRFARLYLLKLDLAKGSIRLHDVMQDWLASAITTAPQFHNHLVDSWPDWTQLPDTYAWRWLPWHLARGGRKEEIEKLLWNPVWLKAKLAATDINALIADFEYLKPSREAELIQGALRLSSHVLGKDSSQFPSQMTGRLLPWGRLAAIERLIASLNGAADGPWLRPLWPALDPPGTALLRTLAGHSASVYDVAVTPDGRRAVSASTDKTLKVWDLESGTELLTLAGHLGPVTGVAVSPDGRHAVSASYDRTLRIWELESGSELRTLVGHASGVIDVAVTPDGRQAVSASDDGTLKVWDLESGDELRTLAGHSDRVYSVALAADNRRAVSASWDNTLKVWELESGGELRTLVGHASGVIDVAVTPDSRQAVSASDDGTLKVWDLESGDELRTLAGHSDRVMCVAVTPDGRHAVSASMDNTLKVWDLESGVELRTLTGHSSGVIGVVVTPDGRHVVSASFDTTLKVWDLESGPELLTFTSHSCGVIGVAVTPDGRCAVCASDNELGVWDLDTGTELRKLVGNFERAYGVAVTPDGRCAVCASDNELGVWDLDTGTELRRLVGHSDRVYGVAVTLDGRRAVSASGDRTLKVWDLQSGDELRTLAGHSEGASGVAVTPDGQRAVSASYDRTLKVWNLESGAELRTLVDHSGPVSGVAVTRNGECAVSASWDRTLKVWDLGTGEVLHTLIGHSNGVFGVAVTQDAKCAVSASDDGTLKVWNLEIGNAIATFVCDAVPSCCAWANNDRFVAGDDGGRIYLLALEFPQQS